MFENEINFGSYSDARSREMHASLGRHADMIMTPEQPTSHYNDGKQTRDGIARTRERPRESMRMNEYSF